jgi:hypothetical protein
LRNCSNPAQEAFSSSRQNLKQTMNSYAELRKNSTELNHLWAYMDTRPIATVDLGLDG